MQLRLRELGWDDGKTLRIVYAYAEGREDRLPGLAWPQAWSRSAWT